jgi:hypothetical protein
MCCCRSTWNKNWFKRNFGIKIGAQGQLRNKLFFCFCKKEKIGLSHSPPTDPHGRPDKSEKGTNKSPSTTTTTSSASASPHSPSLPRRRRELLRFIVLRYILSSDLTAPRHLPSPDRLPSTGIGRLSCPRSIEFRANLRGFARSDSPGGDGRFLRSIRLFRRSSGW